MSTIPSSSGSLAATAPSLAQPSPNQFATVSTANEASNPTHTAALPPSLSLVGYSSSSPDSICLPNFPPLPMPLPISLSLPSLSGERQGTLALLHLYCPFYTPSIFQANSHQQAQGHYLHYSLHKGCRDRGIAARAAKQGRGGNILLQISCCSIFGPTRSISS